MTEKTSSGTGSSYKMNSDYGFPIAIYYSEIKNPKSEI